MENVCVAKLVDCLHSQLDVAGQLIFPTIGLARQDTAILAASISCGVSSHV